MLLGALIDISCFFVNYLPEPDGKDEGTYGIANMFRVIQQGLKKKTFQYRQKPAGTKNAITSN